MELKRLVKGSRTHTYNVAMSAINGGFITFLLTVDWELFGFTDQHALFVMIGLNAVDRIAVPMLRNITTGPVGGS